MFDLLYHRAKLFSQNEGLLFVFKLVLVYALWKCAYLVVNNVASVNLYWTSFTEAYGTLLACITSSLLNLVGEETYHSGINIVYVVSSRTVYVREHCLGIPAMVIFSGSILIFKGLWRRKLWFIPLGVIGINLINILRLIFVAIAFEHFPESVFNFNHSYLYVVLTYGLIFLMIAWWMNRETGFSNCD